MVSPPKRLKVDSRKEKWPYVFKWYGSLKSKSPEIHPEIRDSRCTDTWKKIYANNDFYNLSRGIFIWGRDHGECNKPSQIIPMSLS